MFDAVWCFEKITNLRLWSCCSDFDTVYKIKLVIQYMVVTLLCFFKTIGYAFYSIHNKYIGFTNITESLWGPFINTARKKKVISTQNVSSYWTATCCGRKIETLFHRPLIPVIEVDAGERRSSIHCFSPISANVKEILNR